jgi:uncharacterized membrane protein YfcA
VTLDAAFVLLAAGLVAGMMNTLAGGGSLLTLPALVFAGLPATVANGTNRVAILLSSLAATWRFSKEPERAPLPTPLEVGATATGALVGALATLFFDDEAFRAVIGLVMIVALPLALKPDLIRPRDASTVPPWLAGLGFFCVGVYGGFIQAGVGVLLIAAYVGLAGRDLVGANAGKVAVVALYTVPALVVFVLADKVVWLPGLLLAASSMAGSYLGAWWALRFGDRGVRPVLVVGVLASGGRMLGLW